MADVQDFDLFFLFYNPIDYAIDVGLVPIEKVTETIAFGSNWAAVWKPFERSDSPFKAFVPVECGIRLCSMN